MPSRSVSRIKEYKLMEELKRARKGSRDINGRDITASQTREPSTKAKGRKKNKFGRRMKKASLRGGNI